MDSPKRKRSERRIRTTVLAMRATDCPAALAAARISAASSSLSDFLRSRALRSEPMLTVANVPTLTLTNAGSATYYTGTA